MKKKRASQLYSNNSSLLGADIGKGFITVLHAEHESTTDIQHIQTVAPSWVLYCLQASFYSNNSNETSKV